MGIYSRIKEDHDRARELMKKINDTTNRARKMREELFEEFKIDLWSHHKIEEATFYDQLTQMGDYDESLEAKNEHHMVNGMLEELDTMQKDSREWGSKFGAMSELVEHHMDEEEEEFFAIARKEFSREKAEDLGRRFDARKKVVVPALSAISEEG